MIEAPQSFVVREECEKAAWQNGFRRPFGGPPGWASFASTTVPGSIHLGAAGPQGPWYMALDHDGVIAELSLPVAPIAGPGLSCHVFDQLGDLYAVLARVYQLSASLPDAPLRSFTAKVRDLPQTTEAEQMVVQRIGQDIFREGLMEYWQGRCPLTGITDPALLRASHIVPWKACSCDAQRLDVHNGLLLSALWDAAFDRGLVTFADAGHPEFSSALSEAARVELRWQASLSLTPRQRENLVWHRTHIFNGSASRAASQNHSNNSDQ
ncbi:restriction endonuclease [Pararhizobium antarcticum]|uniref:Restriction endonuclease n=2 Tax=Pararhizobium antarcticum TaxID=1798805 RepID=A0A657LPR0_9HYPH|nr:restriction endonuclease [Pararhizobium antarcticum]